MEERPAAGVMADDPVVRLVVLAIAALVVVVVARLLGGHRQTRQPIDLRGAGLRGALVLFTSTDCANCATVRSMLAASGLRPREVTWELEPATMERAGVGAVPLTVVVDGEGAVIEQWTGVPTRRWVRRAVAAARRVNPSAS